MPSGRFIEGGVLPESSSLAGIVLRDEERLKITAQLLVERRSATSGTASAEAVLQRCRISTEEITALLEDATGADAQAKLEEAHQLLKKAEEEVAQASYLLPTYETQRLCTALKQLKERLYSARGQVVPRKKFAFSKTSKRISERASETATSGLYSDDKSLAAASASFDHDQVVADNIDRGINGARSSTIVKTADELSGADFVLSDLRNCVIHLRGRTGALRIHNVKDCLVYAGPVAGATFVNDVHHSCLILNSHQLRIHSSSNVDFFLHVQSGPIIEHCSDVRFGAPLSDDPDTAELFRTSRVAEESNRWSQVQDFCWLKSTPSPNW